MSHSDGAVFKRKSSNCAIKSVVQSFTPGKGKSAELNPEYIHIHIV